MHTFCFRIDFREIHIWILEELPRKNGIYLTILTSDLGSPFLFSETCRFVGIILQIALQSEDNQTQTVLRENRQNGTLIDLIYDSIVRQLDDRYEKRQLDRLRTLVSLLRIVSAAHCSFISNVDEESIGYAANKLLHFIAAIQSLAQAGSNFNKNCLFTIGNLLANIERAGRPRIAGKYIRLLSGLCGHVDVELRAAAWSILRFLSTTIDGAAKLIKELAYLPGGFHACCLSTFMDPYEASVVRETAGILFATLLTFRSGTRTLPDTVRPKCADRVSVCIRALLIKLKLNKN